MREDQLELTVRDRFQIIFVIIINERFARVGIFLPFYQRQDADTVNLTLGQRCTADICQCRKKVDIGSQFVTGRSRLGSTFPVHHARDTVTSVESGSFSLTQSAGRTGMVTVVRPRTVIRRKDTQCIFFQPLFAERFQYFTDTPVQFHHDIAIQSLFALSFKLVGNGQRNMRHGMCQIDKERFILVLLDEIDRTVGIIRCKL